eukprot:jgi/Antlo1/1518/403
MSVKDIRDAISYNLQYFSEEELSSLERILESATVKETEEIRLKSNVDKSLARQKKEQGNAEYKKGNYLEAIESYTEAIAADPFDEILYSNRAAAYAMLKINDQGIEDCLMAVKLNPRFAKAYIRLGDFYSETDYETSYKYYKKAQLLEPNNYNVEVKIKRLDDRKKSDGPDLSALLQNEDVMKLINSENFKKIAGSISRGELDISEKIRSLNLK